MDKQIVLTRAVCRRLYNKYKIVFITARKNFPNYNKSTEDWLYKYNYQYHQIIYTTNALEKLQYIDTTKKHLFIDDLKINWENIPIDDINMIDKLNEYQINYIQFNNDWNIVLEYIQRYQ